MDNKNNIVKGVFTEKDFLEFEEVEKLIKEAKPTFKDNFEEEIVKNIVHRRKNGSFFLKAVIAASLMIFVLFFSTLFFRNGYYEKQTLVTNETIAEVLSSIGGKEELGIDEILTIMESNKDKTSDNYIIYLEYYFGENDEEDFS